ncbi:tetratricopeptide repeat protein [Herbidospora sp. RD11066]
MRRPEPYVGLRPFQTTEAAKFFGREKESHDTANLWQSCQLTVLCGPHGSGKTSLINAGVIPLIDGSVNEILPVSQVSIGTGLPGTPASTNPYTLAALSSWAPDRPADQLIGLSLSAFFPETSVRTVHSPAFDEEGEKVVVLAAIDNFEDVFAGPARSHQDQFIDQIVEALSENPHLHLLISITEDRSHVLLNDPRLRRLPKGVVRLGRMTRSAALRAVTAPVEGTGSTFAPGVPGALLDRLPAHSADDFDLVRLQLACVDLWNAVRPGERTVEARHIPTGAEPATTVARAISEIARRHLETDPGLLRSWLYEHFIKERTSVYRGEALTEEMPNEVVDALVKADILATYTDHYGNRWHAIAKGIMVDLVEGFLQNASPTRSSSRSYLAAAGNAFREGNFRLARVQAQEALSRAEDIKIKGEIEAFLGNVAFSQELYTSAIEHYEKAATLFELFKVAPVIGRMLAAIGRSRRAQGHITLATAEFRAALGRVPNDSLIRTDLAWAMWYGGHPEDAQTILGEILNEDSDLTAALLARAQMFADLNRPEDALRDFKRVLPLRRPPARAAYALALASAGQFEKAKAEVQAIKNSTNGHGPATLRLARVAQLTGDPGQAARLARWARDARSPALPPHLKSMALELLSQT